MNEPRYLTQLPDVTDPEVYKTLRKQVEDDLTEDRRRQQIVALQELFGKLNPVSWFKRSEK